MKTTRCAQLAITCAVLLFGAATLHAQATRTWVSGVGDDANPCSRTAPCKTFAGAISKTAEGGEIDALDPGGFGGVTVTKAITIEGTHGAGFGSILNASISGVIINITTGTHINDAVVILRSLYFQGASQSTSGTGASRGVNYLKGARVVIDDCHFENQTTTGITANLTTAGALFVRDCDFSNVNTGIDATLNAAGQVLVIEAENISVHGSTNGVKLTATAGNIFAQVNNSVLSRNIGGNAAQAGSGCTLNLTHSEFHANSTAINAAAGSTVRVNECEIFDNTNGFAGTASSIQSGGNNKLAGNAASITPTGTPLTTQ